MEGEASPKRFLHQLGVGVEYLGQWIRQQFPQWLCSVHRRMEGVMKLSRIHVRMLQFEVWSTEFWHQLLVSEIEEGQVWLDDIPLRVSFLIHTQFLPKELTMDVNWFPIR